MESWMPAKVRLETVADPAKNAPSAPRTGAKNGQALPVTVASFCPMIIVCALSPPRVINWTMINAPTRVMLGPLNRFVASATAFFSVRMSILRSYMERSTTTTNGITAGTKSAL
jgi:hypothetical protein